MIKGYFFDEVFANRNVMTESFEFITDCLNQAGKKMFVAPNQNRKLDATVSVDNSGVSDKMTGLWIGGQDVMGVDKSLNLWETNQSLAPAQLRAQLSQLLAIPLSQLEIGFQPPLREEKLSCPHGIVVQD